MEFFFNVTKAKEVHWTNIGPLYRYFIFFEEAEAKEFALSSKVPCCGTRSVRARFVMVKKDFMRLNSVMSPATYSATVEAKVKLSSNGVE